jgi:mannose-6-phosphate isomerase-like protein (cupin superfamily)
MVELRRYADAAPFMFGDFELRELTPAAYSGASFAEIVVPIGADRTPRVSEKDHRMYVGLVGDIEFRVDDKVFHFSPGDVLHIDKGEEYGFHNGGYEEARLLLIRVPGPALPGGAQP